MMWGYKVRGYGLEYPFYLIDLYEKKECPTFPDGQKRCALGIDEPRVNKGRQCL
jgi:hypothetical protein